MGWRRTATLELLALLAASCVTYAPARRSPSSPPRPLSAAVIVEGHAERARSIAALLQRRADLRVQAISDVAARLASVAAERRASLAHASALADDVLRKVGHLDPVGARGLVTQARSELPVAPALDDELAVWARIQSVAAVVELLDGQPDQALAVMRALVRVMPSYEPPAGKLPPEVLSLLRRAQVEGDRAERVTVRLDSSPPGAEILVDGVPRGRAPVSVELSQGQHFATAVALAMRATPAIIGERAGEVRLVLAQASPALTASDVGRELSERGVSAASLRAVAVALRTEQLAWVQNTHSALLWSAGAGTVRLVDTHVDTTTSSDDDRRSLLAMAGAISGGWDQVPPPVVPGAGPADAGPDSPWYRRWWGWCLAGAAAIAAVAVL